MIGGLLALVLWLLAIPVLCALGVFCTELAMGLRRSGPGAAEAGPSGPRSVIVMPAHNEAKVIERSVRLTLARAPAGMTLLVVADNCCDDTAALARAAGATVVERTDPDRRGKGYALAHGIAALRSDPPDCVIVLDADAWPDEGALDHVARRARETGRPVQGAFLIAPDKGVGPVARLSNFAHMLKNLVRQRGVARIGGTGFLCGSGMAFPWDVVAAVNLANGEIVEDLVLGLRLVLSGRYPLFAEQARFYSTSAPGDAEATGQRRRWEHGFLAAAGRFSPALLAAAVRTRRAEPLWMALHLLVPPLVLLLTVAAGLTLLAGGGALLGMVTPGLFAALAGMSLAALGLVAAGWRREGRAYLDAADILVLPRYFAAKVSIWAGLLTGRQSSWNRTER